MSSVRLAPVDGVRAVACLLVLGYHTWQFADLPAAAGVVDQWSVGVDLFIVLSGFCLFLPVAKRPDAFVISAFWRHRIRRIVPAYYASMAYLVALPVALVLFWRALGRGARWQPIPDWWQWVTHLTFTHLFFPSTWAGMNGSYWSLALEAQFYAAMPILVWLYRRYGWRGLLGPALFSVIWNLTVYLVLGQDAGTLGFLLGVNLPGRWVEFVAGALAACALQAVRAGTLPTSRRQAAAACYLGLGAFGVTAYAVRGQGLIFLDTLMLGLAAAALLFGLAALPTDGGSPALAHVLSARPIRFLALISYSFYLIHQPTEWYFAQLLRGFGVTGWLLWAAELTLGAAIVTTIAWGMYRLIEAPFLTRSGRRVPPEARTVGQYT